MAGARSFGKDDQRLPFDQDGVGFLNQFKGFVVRDETAGADGGPHARVFQERSFDDTISLRHGGNHEQHIHQRRVVHQYQLAGTAETLTSMPLHAENTSQAHPDEITRPDTRHHPACTQLPR